MGKEYIEREAAIKAIQRDPWIGAQGKDYALSDITTQPKANVVEVRYGDWVYDPNGMDWGLGAWWRSLCGVKNDNLGMSRDINPLLFAGSKWCPHCGAKMDGKESEVDQNVR